MTTVATFLKGLGLVVGVPAAYLLTVGLIPGLRAPAQPLPETTSQPSGRQGEPPPGRQDVSFDVKGTTVRAWLYLPAEVSFPVPCVVMAHGLGGVKAMGLESYALRFQQAGFAVLVFDYRYTGESAGEPRGLIWIPYQLEDWASAVAYVRGLPQVDPTRVGLWGVSFSGGHVLVTAARDERVSCLVAQAPVLDMKRAMKEATKDQGLRSQLGPRYFANLLRLIVHAQRDLARSWLGLSAHKIPLVGKQDTLAVLAGAESWDIFAETAPPGFVNEVCARIVLRAGKYRPIKRAGTVRCPVLLQLCDYDPTTPAGVVADAMSTLRGLAEVKRYPVHHFDLYRQESVEQAVADQVSFFRKHLRPSA